MDLLSLAATFLLQNPDVAVAGANEITRPGTVNVQQMQSSFADLSRQILNCYHRTARYQHADEVERPWSRQTQYGARSSAVIRIQYSGMSKTQYEMTVAVLSKGTQIRTAVIADTAIIPFNKKCQLEEWSGS
jgi:hypothetical protein